MNWAIAVGKKLAQVDLMRNCKARVCDAAERVKMIRAVLFDKDGVLFDFQKTWGGWAVAFLTELADGDDAVFRAMAKRLRFDIDACRFATDSAVIAGTPEAGVELILPLLTDWSFDDLLALSNARAANAALVETAPLAELMTGLRGRGLKLGVATNDAESSARAHLSSVGAEHAFDMIMGSDSGFGAKPEPGMPLGFSTAMQLPPGQIVMIGDSTHDMEAAAAAGMRRVAVLTGPATQADLAPHAEAVLPSIADLPEWLENQ